MSSTRFRHVVWESPELVAYLHTRPWTLGSVILEQRAPGSDGASIFQLAEPEYMSMLLGAQAVGSLLCDRLGVRRCALVTRPQTNTPAQVKDSLRLIWSTPWFACSFLCYWFAYLLF